MRRCGATERGHLIEKVQRLPDKVPPLSEPDATCSVSPRF